MLHFLFANEQVKEIERKLMNKVAVVVLFDVRVKSLWRCKEKTYAKHVFKFKHIKFNC